jgi:hypothetical protein
MTQVMLIKFNEPVWHDTPFLHPQLHTETIEDFFDRTELKNQLRNRLFQENARLTLIQGERRSGKTSLLRLLEHDLKQVQNGQFLPLWLPWQGISSRDSFVDELLESCAFELDVDIPFFVPEGTVCDEIVLSALAQLTHESDKTILVFIDEFDSIIEQSSPAEGAKILKLIHTLINDTSLPFALVITLVKKPDSGGEQAFAHSKTWPLSPFPIEDLALMFKTLLGLSDQDPKTTFIPEVYQLSGGWPYFAKLLMLSLAEQKTDSWDLAAAVDVAVKNPLFERALDHIYTKHFTWYEQGVMLMLALNKGILLTASITAGGEAMETAVSNLIKRNYLKKKANGDICFRIGLLGYWFPQWIRFQEEVEEHMELASKKVRNIP